MIPAVHVHNQRRATCHEPVSDAPLGLGSSPGVPLAVGIGDLGLILMLSPLPVTEVETHETTVTRSPCARLLVGTIKRSTCG
jgi:hypothetical protein